MIHYWKICYWLLEAMCSAHGAGPALWYALVHLPPHHHSTHCNYSTKHDPTTTLRDLHTIGMYIEGEKWWCGFQKVPSEISQPTLHRQQQVSTVTDKTKIQIKNAPVLIRKQICRSMLTHDRLLEAMLLVTRSFV